MPHVTARRRVSKHKRFFPSEEKPRSSFKRTYPLYYDFHFAHGTSWLQATFSPSLPPVLSLDSFSWKRSKCELTASTTGNIFDQKFPRSTSRQKKKSRIVLLKRRGAGLMQDWNRFVFKWLLVSSPEFWDTGRVWKIVLEILQTGMSNY